MTSFHRSAHTCKIDPNRRYTIAWDFQNGMLDKVLPVAEIILDRGQVNYEYVSPMSIN